MLKQYKKQIINGLFLIALLFVTFYLLFKDQEITIIFEYIKKARKIPLMIGVLLSGVFLCSESLIMHYLMRKLNNKVSMWKCIKYSFIGFFYSAITPSASGGQPMQVIYMKKDNINVAESSLVLIIITIAYKVILLLLGFIAIFFNYDILRDNVGGVRILIIYGIAANVIFIALLLIILLKQSFAKRSVITIILWLGRHKIIRNFDKFLKKTFTVLSKYDYCADYVKKNKNVFIYVFFITLLQRLSLFMITYMVYKAFGLRGTSMHEIIALQTMIALAADSLPLPGGIGVSESSFIFLFDNIFGVNLVLSGMLLSRGISYYLLLIISAVITIGAHIQGLHKIRKSGEINDRIL